MTNSKSLGKLYLGIRTTRKLKGKRMKERKRFKLLSLTNFRFRAHKISPRLIKKLSS